MKPNVPDARRGESHARRQGRGPHQQTLRLGEEPAAAQREEALQVCLANFISTFFPNLMDGLIAERQSYLRPQLLLRPQPRQQQSSLGLPAVGQHHRSRVVEISDGGKIQGVPSPRGLYFVDAIVNVPHFCPNLLGHFQILQKWQSALSPWLELRNSISTIQT